MSTFIDQCKKVLRVSFTPPDNAANESEAEAQKADAPPAKVSPKEEVPVVRKGMTRKEADSLYHRPPSFIDHLPWMEGLEDDDAILLQDNRSVGAVFEITPRGTEGRTEEFLIDIRDAVVDALQDVFDEHDTSPWVMQTYTFNELDLDQFLDDIAAYIKPDIAQTPFTTEYLRVMRQHIQGICRPEGLFFDDKVTQCPWSGQRLRNYLIVYRIYGHSYKFENNEADATPLSLLNETCEKLFNTLAPIGIRHRRLKPREFHHWMVQWFNVYTDMSENANDFAKRLVLSDDEALPFGNQFTESMFYAMPRSDHDNHCWWFDQTATRCISIDGIRKRPVIGHVTGESSHGDSINTMMDQLPEGAVMSSTLVFVPQDTVEIHIDQVAKAAIGDSADAVRTREDCQIAKETIGRRHKLYRAQYACYVRARDVATLNKITNLARTTLLGFGFRAIAIKDDIRALDNYLTNLPMKYDPDKDRLTGWRQAQLTWVQHIANLSPFFGRSVGTGHPGIVQFNRGGEPLTVDPLNKKDRNKNAHMLLLGPTGAGKSVTLAGILTHVIAIHRPRLFIIEAGNSFGLTAKWYESLGLSVNVVSLKPGSGVTLPTYADARRLIDSPVVSTALDVDPFGVDEDDSDDEAVERDILGEMEIIATLMITGGEEKEVALMRRHDKLYIREAILLAAQTAADLHVETLTEHVRDAMYTMAQDTTRDASKRERIREMGDAIGLFCDGFTGEIFNAPGVAWPEVDVTLIDLAQFAREGYEAHLAIAVISLLNMINNIAERDQYKGREIIVPIDEAHIVTTNPLLSPFLVKIAKMWRKLGAWLWLATQDMEDFPGKAVSGHNTRCQQTRTYSRDGRCHRLVL